MNVNLTDDQRAFGESLDRALGDLFSFERRQAAVATPNVATGMAIGGSLPNWDAWPHPSLKTLADWAAERSNSWSLASGSAAIS